MIHTLSATMGDTRPNLIHGMDEPDTLHRFVFEGSDVRGELVQLQSTWQALLSRITYPTPVRVVLGEALAAVSLLAATIKFDGSLILQANGDGPLHMLVVQATGKRTVRGLARWRGEVPDEGFAAMIGDGRLAMTIDPGEGMDRYQGVIDLRADSLAGVLEDYFVRSEQLPTRLWLYADERRAAGLLLQKMPWRSADEDTWNRSVHLAATVTGPELLGLAPQAILRRLFHEEDVRVFEGERVSFSCGCSRERVQAMLHALGEKEVVETLAEQGEVRVDCEFCGQVYRFDAVDVAQLFSTLDLGPAGGTRH